MYLVKFTIGLRVSKDGELEGLDQHEHGGGAYPEQLASTMAVPMPSAPASMPVGAPMPAKAF